MFLDQKSLRYPPCIINQPGLAIFRSKVVVHCGKLLQATHVRRLCVAKGVTDRRTRNGFSAE